MAIIVWSNGCGSKHRKFRVISKYYGDREVHTVQWCFFENIWHDYVTDSYYSDTATFNTKQEAVDFIDDLRKQRTLIKTEVTGITYV